MPGQGAAAGSVGHARAPGAGDGVLHLAAGVTSVRDLANDNDALLKMKRRLSTPAPRSARASRWAASSTAPGRSPAHQSARRHRSGGARRGRLLREARLPRRQDLQLDEARAGADIAKLAHEKGLRVSGHVPAFMTAQQFVEAGADEIQHVNILFLNFFFDEVKDTRTPARFTRCGARRDAGSEFAAGALVRAAAQGPQHRGRSDADAFETLFTDRPGKISPRFAAVADRLPPQVRRGFLAGGCPCPRAGRALSRIAARDACSWRNCCTTRGSRSSPAPTACRASLCIASWSCTCRRAFRAGGAAYRDTRRREGCEARRGARLDRAGQTRGHGADRRRSGEAHQRHPSSDARHQGWCFLRARRLSTRRSVSSRRRCIQRNPAPWRLVSRSSESYLGS